MKAVILAAGIGSRLAPYTDDKPKALVEVAGTPLLFRTLDKLDAAGIRGADVIIVGGYRVDVLEAALAASRHQGVRVVMNEKFEPWNNFWSLRVAEDAVGGDDLIQIDGDVLFDDAVLPRMLAHRGEAALCVDVRDELDAETMKVEVTGKGGPVCAVSKKLDPARCVGEYIGLTRLSGAAAKKVFAELEAMAHEGLTNEYYEFGYERLLKRGEVRFDVVDVGDCVVTEIDDATDLKRAEEMLRDGR